MISRFRKGLNFRSADRNRSLHLHEKENGSAETKLVQLLKLVMHRMGIPELRPFRSDRSIDGVPLHTFGIFRDFPAKLLTPFRSAVDRHPLKGIHPELIMAQFFLKWILHAIALLLSQKRKEPSAGVKMSLPAHYDQASPQGETRI
jgi:hypothetical protein